MKRIFYYVPNSQANGVKVITKNFVSALNRNGIECITTDTMPQDHDEIVIPGGVKNGIDLINAGFSTKIAIMGDAISLGYLNKIIHYFKERYCFNKDFLYSIYGYFRYKREEKTVVNKYEKIILFSQTDVDYLVNAFNVKKDKFIVVPNGANFIEPIERGATEAKTVKIGILSSWGAFQSFEENNWFLQRYWRKFAKRNHNIVLVLAGRGAELKKIKETDSIKVLGEVPDLKEFFDSIDFFLSVNPKGCGILNRVLDAMVYKVPIIGIEESFTGFPHSDEIFLKFNDYNSFEKAILNAIKNKLEMHSMAEKAYSYAQMNHNWEKNYDYLVNNIISVI